MYYREVVVTNDGGYTVHIHFTDEINEGHTFDDFLERWLSLYESKTLFRFEIYTKEIQEIPSLFLCFKMAWFIYMLKQRYPTFHYLQETHLHLKNIALRRMIDFVFAIQIPVAPVYYHMDDEVL